MDKIDENFMKMKFNENYFLDGKDEDVEEIKDYTNYSFIDLSAKEQKNDVLDEGFEICNKYIEVAKNDWEVLSKNSEDDE